MPSGAQDPLSFDVPKRHGSPSLLDLCRFCFDFDTLQSLRRRAAPINIPPSRILSVW